MPSVRRMTFDLNIEQVRQIVRDLDGALELVGFRRLDGGSKEVYRIDLRDCDAPVVLKLYGDQPEWTPAKEALVAGWLERDLGVPTPRWLKLDERRAILPLRFALMTWLPGQTARGLIGEAGMDGVYLQMGALLRRVHAIPMQAYGYIVGDGLWRPQASNSDYVISTFERAFHVFRDRSGDAELSRRVERAARSRFALLAHSAGPVLCHDDFQQGNVLAARDETGELRLTGLIDFGNALSGDAVSDLAKALFCCAHDDPQSREPLLAGYGPIDHPDPAGALWLYTLLHRLIMWNWLTSLGDAPTSIGPAGLLRDLDDMTR